MAVYAFQRGEDGPVKIGFSDTPMKRRDMLQTAMPEKLRTIGLAINEGREFEKKAHWALRKSRLGGEWFAPSDEVMKFVADNFESLEGDEIIRHEGNEFWIFPSDRHAGAVRANWANVERFKQANPG